MAEVEANGGRLMAAVRTVFLVDLLAAPVALAVRSLLAKTLPAADFGLYAVVYALLIFLGSLAAPDIAFTTFVASARAAGRRDDVSSWGLFGVVSGLATGVVLAIGLVLTSGWLSRAWLHADLAAWPLVVSSIGLAAMPVTYNVAGVLAGLGKFGLGASLQLARQAAFLALAAVAIFAMGRHDLVYAALSASALIVGVGAVRLVGTELRAFADPSADWRARLRGRGHDVWDYYAPLMGKAVGSQLTDKFGLFVLAGTLPLSLAGAYGAVMPLAALTLVFTRWTYSPLATHFAERAGADDEQGAERLLWRSTGLFAVFACLIALAVALVAPTAIVVLFTPEYLVATDAFVVLLLATAASGLGGPSVRALLATARTRAVAAVSLTTGVAYIAAAYAAARVAGLVGVAAASLATLTVQSLAYLVLATRPYRNRARYIWTVAPFVLAAAIYWGARMAFGMPGVTWQLLIAVVACLAFIALMMLTPLVSADDLRLMIRSLLRADRGGAGE